jgi:RTX calcium-binding nonapeptide repeat (4 copies)
VAVAAGFCALTATAALAVGPASGGFTPPEIACHYDPATRTATIEYGDPSGNPSSQLPAAAIARKGRRIAVSEVSFGPTPCDGGTPTVDNTDLILLRRVADPLLGTLTFFHFEQGLLAPGATSEPGGSEIEIDAELGEDSEFGLDAGSKDDYWVFGTSGDRHQANFNPAEKSPDADLVVHDAPETAFDHFGSRGDDRLVAAGGKGTGGPLAVDFLLFGGPGADVVVGGSGDEYMGGGTGEDRLKGLAGDDRIDLDGSDGADRIDCGRGEDRAHVTKADRAKRCEHTSPR